MYGLGAPGYYGWRGNLVSMTSNSASNIMRLGFGQGTTDLVNYLGYATTAGYFSVTNRLDYAVSVPRFGSYTGAVSELLGVNYLRKEFYCSLNLLWICPTINTHLNYTIKPYLLISF